MQDSNINQLNLHAVERLEFHPCFPEIY